MNITIKIPEGYMLVPIAWNPIMEEIHRRAGKMAGDTEFQVTIHQEDLDLVDAALPCVMIAGEPAMTFAQYRAKHLGSIASCEHATYPISSIKKAFKAGQASILLTKHKH